MLRVDSPNAETEKLIAEAMRSAGISAQSIERDERGRLVGTKTGFLATGYVVADIATLPGRSDICYVSLFGRSKKKGPLQSILLPETPQIIYDVRAELRKIGGDDVTVV